jgi:hypothetical protein
MHMRIKLLLAALGAALLLTAAVGTASARRLAIGPPEEIHFRLRFPIMKFIPTGGTVVKCELTLEGSFHSRTITKVEGQLIGFITKAEILRCETALLAKPNQETLPWHVRYISFTGTLPVITAITILVVNSSYEVREEIFGIPVTCRYKPASLRFINSIEAGGKITGQAPGAEMINSETAGCPALKLEKEGITIVDTKLGRSITVVLVA